MYSVHDHTFTSTLIDDLRKQRTRLWVRTLILSLILGLFGIFTMVLAVLYATKTCAVSSAPTEISSTGGPTTTVSKTVFGTWTVTATPDLTPAPSTVTIWTSTSPGPGEAGPVTELMTTTEFTTIHSTIVSTKTVTKEMVVTSTATKTAIATSVTTATATRKEKSVETTTSVSTKTITVSNQSGPTKACQSGMTMGGKRLLDLDQSYYSGLFDLTIKNQPNSAAAAHEQDVNDIARSSLWRCGDNGWIAWENYCLGGVTPLNDQADSCIHPTPNVP